MTLSELKAREAAWKKAYDALIEESDNTPGDVTEEHSARFDELHEEGKTIEAEYAKLKGAEARLAGLGFAFLFRNVSEMGRGPTHVIALCQAAIA